MRVLIFLGKILAIPALLVVTIIQWLLVYLISFSSVILNLFAGLLFLCGVLMLTPLMNGSWKNALMPFLGGFLLFMLPIVGEAIATFVALLQKRLVGFVKS